MPTPAVVAGAIAGVLAVAALGVGLGVGLSNRDEDNDAPTTAEATPETSADTGTRDLDAGVLGTEADAPSPIDSTFAFAPRAFGPGSAPDAAAPPPMDAAAPDATAPMPAVDAPVAAPVAAPVPAPAPAPVPVPAPAPAPEPEEPEEAPSPAPEPDEAPTPAPAPSPEEELETESGAVDTSNVQPGADGKYTVCPGSWEQREACCPKQDCGVTINADGSVQLGEFFGGFDGFFSVDPADGHENCFNHAVASMFQQEFCEIVDEECVAPAEGSCVCFAEDKDNPPSNGPGWPGNVGVIKFLTDLRDTSNPTDWDHPEDYETANNGGRVDNQVLVTGVFEEMITVGSC